MTGGAGRPAALSDLPAVIEDLGYGEVLSSLAPCALGADQWPRLASTLEGPIRALVGLLLLHERTPVTALPSRVADVLPVLQGAGLCEGRDGSAWLPGLVLVRVHGFWLFIQVPHVSSALYLGDDSLALANRISVTTGGTALDLCSGPGLQALVCSLRSSTVVAGEVNPVAAALGGLNVALNRRTHIVSVRCADLYECAPGQQFDNVVANPPLVPIPAELRYPFIGDGGPDGMRVVWRILRGLREHLHETGVAQVIGMTLSDGLLPLPLDELEAWALEDGFDLSMSVTAHIPAGPGSRWVTGVSWTIVAHAGGEVEATADRLVDGYRAAGASHVCTYFLRARRGDGSLQFLDVSSDEGSGSWFP